MVTISPGSTLIPSSIIILQETHVSVAMLCYFRFLSFYKAVNTTVPVEEQKKQGSTYLNISGSLSFQLAHINSEREKMYVSSVVLRVQLICIGLTALIPL